MSGAAELARLNLLVIVEGLGAPAVRAAYTADEALRALELATWLLHVRLRLEDNARRVAAGHVAVAGAPLPPLWFQREHPLPAGASEPEAQRRHMADCALAATAQVRAFIERLLALGVARFDPRVEVGRARGAARSRRPPSAPRVNAWGELEDEDDADTGADGR